MPAYVRPHMVCVRTCGNKTRTARNGIPHDVHKAWSGVLYALSLLLLLLASIASLV